MIVYNCAKKTPFFAVCGFAKQKCSWISTIVRGQTDKTIMNRYMFCDYLVQCPLSIHAALIWSSDYLWSAIKLAISCWFFVKHSFSSPFFQLDVTQIHKDKIQGWKCTHFMWPNCGPTFALAFAKVFHVIRMQRIQHPDWGFRIVIQQFGHKNCLKLFACLRKSLVASNMAITLLVDAAEFGILDWWLNCMPRSLVKDLPCK